MGKKAINKKMIEKLQLGRTSKEICSELSHSITKRIDYFRNSQTKTVLDTV